MMTVVEVATLPIHKGADLNTCTDAMDLEDEEMKLAIRIEGIEGEMTE